MLLNVWSQDSFVPKLQNRKVVLTCEQEAFLLRSEDGTTMSKTPIPEINSSQEETDSRLVLHCAYAKKNGYNYARVKSPDTDIFFILLHLAPQMKDLTILFDTGTGTNKRLLDVTTIAEGYTPEFCSALLALHAFTGCDTTSAFKGIGKVKPIKILQRLPRYIPIFAHLGDSWEIPEKDEVEWAAFLCTVYGKPRFRDLDEVRHHILMEKCGDEGLDASVNVDMSSLPPCNRMFQQHLRRCNFQAGIWKRALEQFPAVPDPTTGHGWRKGEDGRLELLWLEEEEVAILPPELAELLEADMESDDEDDTAYFPGSEDSISTCLQDSDENYD